MSWAPDWSTAEWTAVTAAFFTALAALAALLATLLQLSVLRRGRRPHLSHVLRGHGHVGQPMAQVEIVAANAGPGLAVSPAFAIVDGAHRRAGPIGSGHLQPGEKASVFFPAGTFNEDTAAIVYACRDLDNNLHIWSNDGRYKRVRARRVMGKGFTMGHALHALYPHVGAPPPDDSEGAL